MNQAAFDFSAGEYTVQVFAQQPGEQGPALLSELKLTVDAERAKALAQRKGVLFVLEPESQKYVGQVRDQSGWN
jgi:hypothetical protein